jgi:hypothetical protein
MFRVAALIASEKVALTLAPGKTPVAELGGVTLTTLGRVVSNGPQSTSESQTVLVVRRVMPEPSVALMV